MPPDQKYNGVDGDVLFAQHLASTMHPVLVTLSLSRLTSRQLSINWQYCLASEPSSILLLWTACERRGGGDDMRREVPQMSDTNSAWHEGRVEDCPAETPFDGGALSQYLLGDDASDT